MRYPWTLITTAMITTSLVAGCSDSADPDPAVSSNNANSDANSDVNNGSSNNGSSNNGSSNNGSSNSASTNNGTMGMTNNDNNTTNNDNNTTNNTDDPAANIVDALGTCGGEAANPGMYPNQLSMGDGLHRYTLESADALCNDGSPAVLYVRAATDPEHADDWVMHTQGGAGCGDYASCRERWCGEGFYDASKMSSRWAPASVRATGLHNADPDRNSFAGWNHVYFYYCSSDSWGGVSEATLVDEASGDRYSLYRRGHTIIERAFDEMDAGIVSDDDVERLPSLEGASRVLWTGTSAGATGARTNADWVSARLGEDVEVAAVFDAAVTPSGELLDPEPAAALDASVRERFDAQLAQDTEPFFVDASCAAALPPEELYKCSHAAYALGNHITTPFFVRMDLRDSGALDGFGSLGVGPAEFAQATRALLLGLGDIGTEGLEAADIARAPGVYGPNCGQHVGIETNAWTFESTIALPNGDEVSMHDALVRWLDGFDVALVDEDPAMRSTCVRN